MKHTPGPWKAQDQGQGPRGKTLGICVSGPNGLPMFFLPRGTEQHEANARLIAAAPELLDALRLAAEYVYNPFEPDNQASLYHKLKAVIAKAEGRES